MVHRVIGWQAIHKVCWLMRGRVRKCLNLLQKWKEDGWPILYLQGGQTSFQQAPWIGREKLHKRIEFHLFELLTFFALWNKGALLIHQLREKGGGDHSPWKLAHQTLEGPADPNSRSASDNLTVHHRGDERQMGTRRISIEKNKFFEGKWSPSPRHTSVAVVEIQIPQTTPSHWQFDAIEKSSAIATSLETAFLENIDQNHGEEWERSRNIHTSHEEDEALWPDESTYSHENPGPPRDLSDSEYCESRQIWIERSKMKGRECRKWRERNQ